MERQAVSNALAALACALGWLGWSLLIGVLAHRLPQAALEGDSWLTGQRPWPESKEAYEQRLGIQRWKALLPDAGDALPGGVRKNSLVSRDPATLQRLVEETRRAELVHMAIWPFWIVTALWMPPAGVLMNLVFATLFNLPCLWLQRYNRLLLLPLLLAMSNRQGESNPGDQPIRQASV
jgi:glycosyl-4,4'-diaponeurosporenoate acyltransferase